MFTKVTFIIFFPPPKGLTIFNAKFQTNNAFLLCLQ